MKDWKKSRGDARIQEGHVNAARNVGKVSPMARGKTTRHGKTATTLENGVSSVASKIGNGFKPTSKGK